MDDRLEPSEWTVPEARSMTARLRQVVTTGTEYDGLELFNALCDYLDQLYGGVGFDRLLPPEDRAAIAGLVQRVRGRAGTGSVVLDDNGVPVEPAASEGDPEYDTLVRLDQPVNAAVSLVQGRKLAAELAASGDWQAEVGKACRGSTATSTNCTAARGPSPSSSLQRSAHRSQQGPSVPRRKTLEPVTR